MAPKGKSPFFEPPSLPAYVHTQYKDGPLGGKYSTKHKMHHTCFAHTCNKLSHVCLQKGKFKRVLNNFLLIFLAQPIQPNLSGNGPDWQVTPKRQPRFFSYFQHMFFFNYFMKNPQTTFAPTFLTHIIARIDGVATKSFTSNTKLNQIATTFFGRFHRPLAMLICH